MHLRKLTLTVGLFGALFSTWAFSLGLGEVTLRSTLNQPLDAEIKLLQVRNLSEDEIFIGLAPTADFQRFGIERLFFLQNLKFDVQLDHPNGPLVRIRSDEPVREPYLVFLLEAQSPGTGRLLREYTLLMDLPVFAEESAAPVRAPARQPATRPAEPIRAPQPSVAPSPRPAQQREGEPPRAAPAPGRSVASQSPAAAVGAAGGYVVQANDTLWEIASSVRPSGVSIQQSMLALQEANPDAFINGNINLLKRGQVLRIPDSNEWSTLDQQTAVREVAVQNDAWRGRLESGSGAELAASSRRPASQRSSDAPRGQLTLSAPGDSDRADEVSGAGSSGARGEVLENSLAIASEELDAARRENRELNSRVLELEEQISTMERLLDVSSAELRALQLASEQSQSGQVEPETSAPADENTAEQEQTAEALAESPESSETATEEVASSAPVAPPINTVVSRQPQPSLMDKVMDQIWYLLAAVLAVVAGLAYFLYRRGQSEAGWESFDEDDVFGEDSDDYAGPEEFLEDGGDFDAGLTDDSFDSGSLEDDEEIDIDEPVQAETGDVVAEADIYIAYGKLEQAEEMLRRAVMDDPNNMDVRLKLLEVYVEGKDVEAFDEEYQSIINLGDANATSRAAELRTDILDAPPFAGDLSGGAQQTDLDALADTDEAPLPGQLTDSTSDTDFDGLDLDFNTTELSIDEVKEAGEEPEAEALDFTLELSEEESTDDLSFDFELDSEPTADATDTGSENLLTDLELNLDGDTLSMDSMSLDSVSLDSVSDSEVEADEGSTLSAGDAPTLDDSSFDLDLDDGIDSSDADKPLAFSLDSDEQDDATLNDLALDGLALDDLTPDTSAELSLELDELDETTEAPVLQLPDDMAFEPKESLFSLEDAESVSKDADLSMADDADEGDDGFDMELGDLDLEALDQEMDALVGSVDDEDVAMATPLTQAEVEVEQEAESVADESESLNIDLQLDGLSPEQAAELARDNPFGEDQDFAEDDLEDELDFLADSDEVATKLDLARAYIDMGDQDGARDILDEVTSEGSDEQKREAQELLEKIV